MQVHTYTQKYLDYREFYKKIINKFGEKRARAFITDHLVREHGAMFYTINLYYFGPRPADCERNPEELERSISVFSQNYFDDDTRKMMEMMHEIWDMLEETIIQNSLDVENIHFK